MASKIGSGDTGAGGVKHGTIGGYRLHQRKGVRVCDKCELAKIKWDEERKRVVNGGQVRVVNLRAGVITCREMRKRHAKEWDALFEQAKKIVLASNAVAVAQLEKDLEKDIGKD